LNEKRKDAKMKLKTTILAVSAAIAACTAMSDVNVEDVKCIQRYPWNGLVDIEYTIACDDPEAEIYVNPVGFNGDTGLTVFPTHFTGDGATNTVKAGKHKMVWDARADMGLFASKNFQIKMYAGKTLAPYVVVDLSSGPDGDHFPIRYSLTGPDISDDTCRTTELWLRLIPPGTFMMGSPADELGRSDNEDLHKVTITEPFYIGVFEVTQEQWYRVKGNWGRYGDSRRGQPMEEYVSYGNIRGSAARNSPNGTMVENDSFLGKLRTKTDKNGFDLPTEAQWEYACRVGTESALNTGKNLTGTQGCDNMNEAGRYYVNGYNGGRVEYLLVTADAGSYASNSYGIYDMHGNVAEICRDSWTDHLGFSNATDPLPCGNLYVSWNGSSSDDNWYCVIKGGSWRDFAYACRSAARIQFKWGDSKDGIGFRVSCPGNLQK